MENKYLDIMERNGCSIDFAVMSGCAALTQHQNRSGHMGGEMMSYTTIGKLIEQARREKRGMTREKLSKGICSPQMLYQIEKDQCDADVLMVDLLLQRAGKAPNKLERVLKSEMYHMVRIRDLLQRAILKNKRDLSMKILAAYPDRTNVDQMYRYRMKASIHYHIDRDYDRALENLSLAVNMTLPGFSYNVIDSYLISTIEIENLIAMEKVQIEQKLKYDQTVSEQHLESCMKYIDIHFTDGEEHAKIFAKCAWLRARIDYNKGRYIQAMALCERGIEELRRNTMIYFMLPLLEMMVQAEQQMGISPLNSKWVQYYNTLSFLWKSFAEEWRCIDSFFQNCAQMEYHLDYERIRDERKAKGMTQEEFADGIYQDVGSLSRFETGRMSPNKKTFVRMLDKLGMEKGRYNGYVVTDSFDVMELRRCMDIQLMQHRYVEARETLEQLKRRLDLQINENKTIVAFHEILIANRSGELPAQSALNKIQGFLKDVFDHIPMRNEVLMINHYCLLLRETGQEEEADRIYEFVLHRMHGSKVRNEYRYRSYALLFNNYVRSHRNWSNVVEAMRINIICGKSSGIPLGLNNIIKVLEKEGVSDQELDKWSKAIYYMSDLYYFEKEKEIYKIYLQKERKIIVID